MLFKKNETESGVACVCSGREEQSGWAKSSCDSEERTKKK